MSHPRTTAALWAIAAAMASTMLCGPAQAVDYIQFVNYNPGSGPVQIGGTTHAPGSYTLGAGNSTATSTTQSAAGGSAFASAAGVDYTEAASALVRYAIRLVGPNGSPIGVHVLANGYADGAGVLGLEHLYFADSYFLLQTETPVYGNTNTNRGDGRQSFVVDTTAFLTPNVDYFVNLYANAGAGGSHRTASAEAFVDPVFTVDPAFASLYRLTGVPFDATTGVPEPAAWAMMLLGFAGIGSTLRRRRVGLRAV